MPPLLVATLLLAATSPGAQVTAVTVFNDRARVVREARLELHGSARFELALLPDSVDPGSVRLEVSGANGGKAEVRQVELVHVDTEIFPEAEARKLLDQLDEADDRLALAQRERKIVRDQLQALEGIAPVAPSPDLRGPAPKLNSSGWAQVLAFLSGASERLRARARETTTRIERLARERQKLAAEAQALGETRRRSGLQVTALLSGEGPVRATLSYLVGQTRWRPAWELTYRDGTQPGGDGAETVQARLDGLVSQATGEEWTAANLTLSTAVPGSATAIPELLSWRIGQKERFQPISHAERPAARPAPPPDAPTPDEELRANASREQLRERLVERAGQSAAADKESEDQGALDGEASAAKTLPEGLAVGGGRAGAQKRSMAKPTPSRPQAAPVAAAPHFFAPPTAAPPPPRSAQSNAMSYELDVANSALSAKPAAPTEQIGLSPPPGWLPPWFPPDAPASLAGGFDLAFTAAHPETLESGAAARRVPLFAESWPVKTERRCYPALAAQAWLVAKLRVPAARALPGGGAQLFVGADPAGEAQLKPMAPGEELTLPLGIDRAIKPERNVAQLQSEKGLFSKGDVDDYQVTIELANPYPHSIDLRVFDQLPLQGDERVEVELLRAQPAVTPDKDSGQLEWAFALAAGEKTQLTFAYRLRRPHGARLHQ